jgi:hypothetical protein
MRDSNPLQLARAAPHNLEAEQALLGAILINNEAHDRVSGFLEPYQFFDPLHQLIYETAAKLIAAGKQVTPITLKTFFESAEPIGSGLSAPAYLGQLATNATTIINVRDYGQTIRDLCSRRKSRSRRPRPGFSLLPSVGKVTRRRLTIPRCSPVRCAWSATHTVTAALLSVSPPASLISTAGSAGCDAAT